MENANFLCMAMLLQRPLAQAIGGSNLRMIGPDSARSHPDLGCAGVAVQSVQPDVGIFNSMIAACAHGGEYAKAAHMFESMAEHGCEPDAVTYANLIRAYKKGGQWCALLKLWPPF